MAIIKLSQEEADHLINMLKKSLVSEIEFPEKGNQTEFNVMGEKRADIFSVNIFRGRINCRKYNINARIMKNGIMLLELHINPSNVHMNPDGNKITGSHWHIYNEEYGRAWAFPAEEICSEHFVENTVTFLDRFHVIEKPVICGQLEFS